MPASYTFIFSVVLYMVMTRLTAVIEEEDGVFIASCPEIGTVSQGATRKRALRNLKEATELYLAEFPHARSAQVTAFEVADAAKA